MLNESDQKLERRGHRFVRYADVEALEEDKHQIRESEEDNNG